MRSFQNILFGVLLTWGGLYANPEGEQVVSGAATVDRNGSTLTVNQTSQDAIINWQSFSIQAGETTRFVQPSSDSMVLNRVMGGDPSQIYGSLQANGHVMVINPNGVMVGAGGRIDVGGFVASTLNLSNEAFLAKGDWVFSGASLAKIVNEGTISALGGDVFLLAHQIENRGTISAPEGTVGLGAGTELLLTQSGDDRILVRAGSNGTTGILNAGTIAAAAVELKAAGGNVYALAINNTGLIEATGTIKKEGRVLLAALGGKIENRGTIAARKGNGDGGTIKISTAGGTSGTIGETFNYGEIDASGVDAGTKGGVIHLLGDHVGILDGILDANGPAGGGEILVGGDKLGQNPEVLNSIGTYLAAEARISANATVNGNGGKVILFASDVGRFYGTITARGGLQGGDGGLIETSGKKFFEIGSVVPDASASAGQGGIWLIDPEDLTISTFNNANVTGSSPFEPTGSGAYLQVSTLTTALGSQSVEVRTTGSGSGSGNININDAIDWYSNTNLTLNASGTIYVNSGSGISVGDGAVGDITLKSENGNIQIGASINSENGNVYLKGNQIEVESGGSVYAGGDLIEVIANDEFVNNSSSTGLSVPNGRWVVYVPDESSYHLGGLSAAFTVTRSSAPSSDLPGGNGVVFVESNSEDDDLSDLAGNLGISTSELLALLTDNAGGDLAGALSDSGMGESDNEGSSAEGSSGMESNSGTSEGSNSEETPGQELQPGDSVQLGGGDSGPPPVELKEGLSPEVRNQLGDALR